ncbi:SDR family NAD(P)-dependent oxidoreductase [Paenibacillus sp. GYB003]|uniref:SDR family NAD(P)-dependent oxidoreductase n=1 Tax=Paenibacillus sp. GYB003 TaxID=2994392 RepID=UPI002F96B2C5
MDEWGLEALLLAGRKALITGAGGKIGGAIAERFASEGCIVRLADIRAADVEAAAARLRQSGSDADAYVLDVTDEETVRRVFGELDGLDILVNNAGMSRGRSIQASTVEQWNEVMNANLLSVFLCTKYALPLLKHSTVPAIVNMSSINASRMNPGLPAYAAAKSGIIALTQQTALEGAAYRIRANCISPGLTIGAERQQELRAKPGFDIDLDCYPLGRLGYPEDVANAALFLASDLSSFVNGINLVVDGGMSLQAVSGLVRPELRRRWKTGVYRLEPEE